MNGGDQQHGFLLLLLALLLILSGALLKPFLAYLLGATLLAFLLTPLQDRFSAYVGDVPAALTLMVFTLVAFVAPFVIILRTVARDADNVIDDLKNSWAVEWDELRDTLKRVAGVEIDLREQATHVVNGFASSTLGGISNVLNTVSHLIIGMFVLIFALFYMLKDGRRFVSYIRCVAPLPHAVTNELLSKVSYATWAVIGNHVLVAILQGLVAGVGLLFAGVPNFVFWTFVMTITAFVPVVGTFLVWGPAAVYLVTIDRPIAGILLSLYGSVVVALTDNVLRTTALSDGRAQLHPSVILIAVVGGVYVFGAPGLLIGPVVFGALKAVLEAF